MPLVAGVHLLSMDMDVARAVGALALTVAQQLATVFASAVGWLVLPLPLGLILLFLLMICLLQNATVPRKKPPREKESMT